MNGLNVKKLTAIGMGAALVGAALVPIANAQSGWTTRGDVVNLTTGLPLYDIVVGANAAGIDAVVASNIATALSRLAYTTTAAATEEETTEETVTPSGSAYTGKITIPGGAQTIASSGSWTQDSNTFNSISGAAELKDKQLNRANLSYLIDSTISQTYTGTSYSDTCKESIWLDGDIKFDNIHASTADLILELGVLGDFNYTVNCKIPLDESATDIADFSDGDNDFVKVPMFGEWYTLFDVDVTRSGGVPSTVDVIRLIKDSSKKTLAEGDEITELTGKNDCAGKKLKVKFVGVTQTGSGAQYQGTFELYDEEGNLLDTQRIASSQFLNDLFRHTTGSLCLQDGLFVSSITAQVQGSDLLGSAIVTSGGGLVELRNNKQYPYDAADTDSTNDYWYMISGATGSLGTPDANQLSSFSIRNNERVWDDAYPTTANRSPVWAAGNYAGSTTVKAALSATGQAGATEAVLMDKTPATTAGYGFAKVKFEGFRQGSEKYTTFKIGNGSVVYKDNSDSDHTVPFYMKIASAATTNTLLSPQSFVLDGATYWFKLSTIDVNFVIGADNNVFNGGTVSRTADFNLTGDTNFNSVFSWPNSLGSSADVNRTRTLDINGVSLTCARQLLVTVTDYNCVTDGNFQIATNGKTFDTIDVTQTTDYIGGSNRSKAWFYDDNNQTNKTGLLGDYHYAVPLSSSQRTNGITYYYTPFIVESGSGRNHEGFHLLLSANPTYSAYTSTQNNNAYSWDFNGTDIDENGIAEHRWYWPDKLDVSNVTSAESNNDFYVALFRLDTNKDSERAHDTIIYINTSDGKVLNLPNNNMSSYTADVNVSLETAFTLADTGSGSFQKAYTDYGTRLELDETAGTFTATIPDARLNYKVIVYGSKTEVSTTADQDVSYTCEPGDETVEVTVGTVKYKMNCPGAAAVAAAEAAAAAAGVKNYVQVSDLVRLDSEAAGSAGPHIIVGGWVANRLAEGVVLSDGTTLEEALQTSEDQVFSATEDGSSVIVAGFDGQGTLRAARDLVRELNSLAD